MIPPNLPCECNDGCNPGWCLHRGSTRVRRNGVELLVCFNCTLTGDVYIEDSFGYCCPNCRGSHDGASGALCLECMAEFEARVYIP